MGEEELENEEYYRPMQAYAERLMEARTINAFNSIFIWGKVIKYIGFMPYIKTLLVTIETCWQQYLSFLFMFLVTFLAFVIAYTIGFGETIRELSSVGATSVYLCRSFLGDINLGPVYEADPMFGAALILCFMLGIYFLMLNVFFAILASALDEARDRKVQDFRQEMLLDSMAQIKACCRSCFSCENKIRAVAPGLWAQMYKKTRMKRKQQEKKRLQEQKEDKRKAEKTNRNISHDTYAVADRSDQGDDEPEAADKRDVLKAVEHMAGKLLTKIQGLSFELTTEMKDVIHNVGIFQHAVDDAQRQLGDLLIEQKELQEAQQ